VAPSPAIDQERALPSPSLVQFVAGCAWARAIPQCEVDQALSAMYDRDVAAGEIVYRRGDFTTHWVGVIDGLIKTCTTSADGRSTSIAGVPMHGWIGEVSLSLQNKRQFDLVAMRRSRLAMMPRETFAWLCETSIRFNRFLNVALARRMSRLARLLATERLQAPSCRVALSLGEMLATQDLGGDAGHLDISQEELAHLVGLSRQHTNRALRNLEDAGIVIVHHGSIDVPDVNALRTIVP
jgi:CRP-like cAMP-binding protein